MGHPFDDSIRTSATPKHRFSLCPKPNHLAWEIMGKIREIPQTGHLRLILKHPALRCFAFVQIGAKLFGMIWDEVVCDPSIYI